MRFKLGLGALGLVLAIPSAATAAEEGTRSVAAMLACRTVGDDAGRLRCFDRAAADVAAARSSGELVTLDRSKVVTAKRKVFGLPAARPGRATADGGDALAAVQQIDSIVAEVRPAEYGRFLIALTGNGVWKNAEPLGSPPARGAAIRIVRAGFGGFRATVGKGRPFLIRRVQ